MGGSRRWRRWRAGPLGRDNGSGRRCGRRCRCRRRADDRGCHPGGGRGRGRGRDRDRDRDRGCCGCRSGNGCWCLGRGGHWRRPGRRRGAGRRRHRGLLGCGPAGDQPGTGALERWRRRWDLRLVATSDPRCGGRGQVGIGGLDEGRRGRHLGGCRLFGGGSGLFGRRGRLLWLHRATQTLTVCLPTGAVCLGVLDGRRMALYTHPQGQAEVERLLVGQTELVSELVDPDLLRQRLLLPFLHVVGADTHIRPSILAHHGPAPPEANPSNPARPDPNSIRSWSTRALPTSARNARLKAWRLAARSRHSGDARQSHAPRPGSVRLTANAPESRRTSRISPSVAQVRRQPMQVRNGAMPGTPRPHRRWTPRPGLPRRLPLECRERLYRPGRWRRCRPGRWPRQWPPRRRPALPPRG